MTRLALVVAFLLVGGPAVASPAGLDGALELEPPRLLAQADAAPEAAPGLDFDLLGEPPAPLVPGPDPRAVDARRAMLKVHQALGIGLMALEASTLVIGQLHYYDRYGGGSRSGRYNTAHAALAYTTFGFFVTNELLAFLAPSPIRKERQGFDRATLHRVAMITAAVGMLTQVGMGIYSAHVADWDTRRDLAKVHLGIGYGTYAAMLVGASAFVF